MHLHLNPWIFIPIFVLVMLGIDQLILRGLRARRRRRGVATDDPRADERRDQWRADLIGRSVVVGVVLVVVAVGWVVNR